MPQNGTIENAASDFPSQAEASGSAGEYSAVPAARQTLAIATSPGPEGEQRDTGPLGGQRTDRLRRTTRLRVRILGPRCHAHQFAVPPAVPSHADVHNFRR